MFMPRRAGFGSVRKRSDDRWEIRITVGGKRCSYYAPSKASATAMLKEFGHASASQLLAQPTKTTVADLFEQWLAQGVLVHRHADHEG